LRASAAGDGAPGLGPGIGVAPPELDPPELDPLWAVGDCSVMSSSFPSAACHGTITGIAPVIASPPRFEETASS